MGQDLVSYESVCKLIGGIILENHHQVEQLGQGMAQLQQQINSLKEENMRLTAELQRIKQNDNNRTRTDNT